MKHKFFLKHNSKIKGLQISYFLVSDRFLSKKENATILDMENNSQKLSFPELLYINKLSNVNKIQDLDKLSSSYYGILKLCLDKKL
jgi:hypothetical protein